MKHWQFILLLGSATFFSCKKQISTETATAKTTDETTARPIESMYFDLRSNPGVKMPAKFASIQQVVDFMTKNYKRVNKDGSPYGTTKGMNAAVTARTQETTPSGETMPSAVNSINSGSTAGFIYGGELSTSQIWDFESLSSSYNISDICPVWLNTSRYYTPEFQEVPGSKVFSGSISAYYAERGITCTLKFNVKYAPGQFTKVVYANNTYPTLQISGTTGYTDVATAFLYVYPSSVGTAIVYGSQNEYRAYIITTSGSNMFKPGFAENYPPGTVLPDGSEVKYSYTTTTSYYVAFNLQFLDYDVIHRDGEYCDWLTGVPSVVYMDAGTNFTGIPN